MSFTSLSDLLIAPLPIPLDAAWLGPASATMDLLFLALVVAILVAMLRRILRLVFPRRPRARSSETPQDTAPRKDAPAPNRHAARHMAAVDAAAFSTVPLMNKAEYRIFRALENAVRTSGGGYRLMAQTSLQELVRPTGAGSSAKAANYAIMAKRLDFAVIDATGHLAVAIEYQGAGHYQKGAFIRDAIKREVVRKAGAEWLELQAEIEPENAAARLRALLIRPTGLQPRPERPRAFPPLAT